MKKFVVVVLALLMVFGIVNAVKADSPFGATFGVSAEYPLKPTDTTVTTAPVGTNVVPEFNHAVEKAVYFNSKGECWIEGLTVRFQKSYIYMFNVDLKTGEVLKAVPIGYREYPGFTVQSDDGRYLFIANITLSSNHYFIDADKVACFDLEKGDVLWNKYFFGPNYDTFTIYPYKDSVIMALQDVFTWKSRIIRVNAQGNIMWRLDSDPLSITVFVYNDKVYAMSPDGKGYLCEYDINTGEMLRKSNTAMLEFGANETSKKDDISTFFYPAYFSYGGGKSQYGFFFNDSKESKDNNKNGVYVGKIDLDTLTFKRMEFAFGLGEDFITKNSFTVGKNYLLWMDISASRKQKQQRLCAYKDGHKIWSKELPLQDSGGDSPDVLPTVSGGYLYYACASSDKVEAELHRIEIATGKDELVCTLGKHLVTYVCRVDSTAVWVYAIDEGENKKEKGELIKVIKSESTLTVNSNTEVGDYEISRDGKKMTAHYGVPVTLPPGTYTITPLPSTVINGIEVPKPVTVTLKNKDNKTVAVQYKDTAPPTLTVNDIPEPKVVAGTAFFTVTGLADDNFSGIKSITVNGMNASYDRDKKSWSATVMLMSKGIVEFDVAAYDNAGNKTEKKVHTVYYPPVEMKLQIDSSTMVVNNEEEETLDSPPVIIPKWGRTVVPIRAIVEALGGTIAWEGTERKVTVEFSGTTIEMWIGKAQAEVNGVMEWIDESNHDVKPVIINSRTMLPLRFVVEHLGCTVDWDGTTRTITINYGG